VAIEEAARTRNDYDVFMAVANHVGHDKRGNVTYVRDPEGNEIVEEVEERVREYENGRPVYQFLASRRKVVDDNTAQIAEAFRAWLSTLD
jgi:type I restriction enzyme M protein